MGRSHTAWTVECWDKCAVGVMYRVLEDVALTGRVGPTFDSDSSHRSGLGEEPKGLTGQEPKTKTNGGMPMLCRERRFYCSWYFR
jgi:hypothetical protein